MNTGTFPPNLVELQQRLVSQYGRVGATKIYTHPPLGAAIAAGAPSPVTDATPITFRARGTVIAIYGQERLGTVASFATTEVKVAIGGDEDLFTTGSVGAFAPMLALFGPLLNWFPLVRRVDPSIPWIVSYRNQDAGNAKNPQVFFAVIEDADVARSARG